MGAAVEEVGSSENKSHSNAADFDPNATHGP
jgi:hypothetical protein